MDDPNLWVEMVRAILWFGLGFGVALIAFPFSEGGRISGGE